MKISESTILQGTFSALSIRISIGKINDFKKIHNKTLKVHWFNGVFTAFLSSHDDFSDSLKCF